MPHRRSFLAACLLLPVAAFASARAHDARLPLSGEDWWIRPDPPSNDKDLEVTYAADDPDVVTATYTVDGAAPVKVDLTKGSTFTIPASALRGKRFVKLDAKGGGERGFRIVRFPSPR